MVEKITLQEALERLRATKAEQAGVTPQEIKVRERVHLEKFDGGRADIAAGLEPSEYVVMEDGVVVYREVNGQPAPPEG